jgi:hypothetical protein
MSSKQPTSAIVDSVVLHYFLLVQQDQLLLNLLGSPLFVPRVIYDPDEETATKPSAMSEMTRAIDYYERQAADLRTTQDDHEAAAGNALRLRRVQELHERGLLIVTDMTDEEWAVAAALTNPKRADEFGLRFPLHSGEAACVAIAVGRGWIVASDDSDALKALRRLRSSHGYERVRKLLTRGAREGLITKKVANTIHAEMRKLGFWDHQPPFP